MEQKRQADIFAESPKQLANRKLFPEKKEESK